ncbi:similar to GTPase Ras2p [Botrytis cinerea T4]|uniref:Similar to GTPase Ras2p n=1 Tax=Botryotinia fuckeliana (strain T4) TaxID=999810 RepID=G2YG07_BOTF4|nr:similar to GTPase Ras2p [Botrytis cinerea T4]
MAATSYDSNRITITILGDGGVGKSALTLRLVKSQWTSDYDPTIEDSYTLTRRIDGQTYHLSITDTAGQEEYRGMWQSANGSMRSDAFLMVYDITRRESLDALDWFDELVTMEGEVRGEEWRRAQAESSLSKSRSKTKKFQSSNAKSIQGGGFDYGYSPPIKIIAGT